MMRRFIGALCVGLLTIFVVPQHAASAASGETWTSQSIPGAWNGVAYGNGVFVAVAGDNQNTGNILRSTDGLNWTTHAAPQGTWETVTYGNGVFVAIAYGGTNAVMTSTDGINWQVRNAPSRSWYGITYGAGRFVAVADASSNNIISSVDGEQWEIATGAPTSSLAEVIYINGLFLALSYDTTSNRNLVAATSVNGTTWTSTPNSNDPQGFWEDIAHGGNTLVAVGRSGKIAASTDNGATWTVAQLPNNYDSRDWRTVTFGDGKFVAVTVEDAAPNKVMTSTDGLTWQPQNATFNGGWWRSTYAHGLFVVVGFNGAVMTSGTFAIPLTPAPEPEQNQTPAPQAPSVTTTVAPTTTVKAKVKKADTLPATGSSTFAVAMFGVLLLAGGAIIAARKRVLR